MRKSIKTIFAIVMVIGFIGYCGRKHSSKPENRTYETGYSSSSTYTVQDEDKPYLDNRLQTGTVPYANSRIAEREESAITVRTSSEYECDVVAIVKQHGGIVRNAYILAGDSYTFYVPNGNYQVFFYGGKGWNPDKRMSGGCKGGFVANESFSKDSEVKLNNQELGYELIPQRNGNFSTLQSNASEMF